MKARHVPGLAELLGEPERYTPGDFDVVTSGQNGAARTFLWFVCPGPCRGLSAIALVTGPPGRTWQWDGNLVSPTLTPSIDHAGCWHGWLRGGEFVAQ